MYRYTFCAEITKHLQSEYALLKTKASPPALSLLISFCNRFNHDFTAWDSRPEGDIVIEKIVELTTCKVLKMQDLDVIAQIEIRSRCFDYLRSNQLMRYPNVIPFQSYPYRIGFGTTDTSKSAKIIQFSAKKAPK